MKKIIFYFLAVLTIGSCKQKEYVETIYAELIPAPQTLKPEDKFFKINNEIKLSFPNELQSEGYYLKELIESSSPFEIPVDQRGISARKKVIILELTPSAFDSIDGFDKHRIEIFPKYIHIKGENNAAVMRGIQTLRQLFPVDFHSKDKTNTTWEIPCMIIDDHAKFEHRGMLLDCCRHFFDKEVVKKYIDLLALYKMNVLHWHLTEDQAWRIEIDAFPELTKTGAFRTELDGTEYGGYYTKEDIREIIAYAHERHISVIPEIELPGHSQAAIASYPYLSCTGDSIEVANDWGVFKDIYCAGNDSTFIFLETVLDEVLELFPSEYIHIGGDEAPKTRWENCAKCQHRMSTEQLNSEEELQSYFIKRIDSYLEEKDRKIIGWDEILEGGLSDGASVQSWRGMEGGIHAAKEGHQVIMSPTSHCYFDYDLQSIDLEKVYHFDPIPSELDDSEKKWIIGGECNMWTEHVPDESNLDSKVFPRILAMAEVLWSYPKNRDYKEFYQRTQTHYPMLKNLEVDYGYEALPIRTTISHKDGFPSIEAELNLPETNLSYRWICDTCSPELLSYKTPITVDRTGTIEFIIMKDGKVYGNPIYERMTNHLGLGAEINYESSFSEFYSGGGEKALIDGTIASLDFRDGKWQGSQDKEISFIIDLKRPKAIEQIKSQFYQYNNAWIFLPENVSISWSLNGETWNELSTWKPSKKAELRGQFTEEMRLDFEAVNAQYIKLEVKNIGRVPGWHEAAGSDAWVFIDEIQIR